MTDKAKFGLNFEKVHSPMDWKSSVEELNRRISIYQPYCELNIVDSDKDAAIVLISIKHTTITDSGIYEPSIIGHLFFHEVIGGTDIEWIN